MNPILGPGTAEAIAAAENKIDKRMIDELGASAPAYWQQIELIVDVVRHEKHLELKFEIRSPEGHPASEAVATNGLHQSILDLLAMWESYGYTIVGTMNGIQSRDGTGWLLDMEYDYDYLTPPAPNGDPS